MIEITVCKHGVDRTLRNCNICYPLPPRAPNLPKDTHVYDANNGRPDALPKIGRLIHVRGYDKCRAAIVTGESSEQVSGYPRALFITIFAPNLKTQESVLIQPMHHNNKNGWHYVDECTD